MSPNTPDYQRRYYQAHREYFVNWYADHRYDMLQQARATYRRRKAYKAREAMRLTHAKAPR